ncbi:hypothetical protein DIPPA_56922 [Diplonema papillatum]|nr:hypothetical protein DIPPA_60523 [Diplonema papillatum]KAJ9441153.1 hypothetical protein DIPPA_56019 [Diplonema papillatum]KAJ9449248.1 hypothetical protein DIPPA_58161 [Diplonema papillatum]KAJ9449917.1 hypothetical protein DIPPA_51760 [Diplonema papillatum]KAJ9453465.1 hypothetical protein DIPPA_57254 [Diplonema papillatum]
MSSEHLEQSVSDSPSGSLSETLATNLNFMTWTRFLSRKPLSPECSCTDKAPVRGSRSKEEIIMRFGMSSTSNSATWLRRQSLGAVVFRICSMAFLTCPRFRMSVDLDTISSFLLMAPKCWSRSFFPCPPTKKLMDCVSGSSRRRLTESTDRKCRPESIQKMTLRSCGRRFLTNS